MVFETEKTAVPGTGHVVCEIAFEEALVEEGNTGGVERDDFVGNVCDAFGVGIDGVGCF